MRPAIAAQTPEVFTRYPAALSGRRIVRGPLSPDIRRRIAVVAPQDVFVIAGDIVTARLGRERHRLVLDSLRTREIVLEDPRPALGYYGTSLYRLRFGSRYGGETDQDRRSLGSFVRIVLEEG